MKDYSLKGVLLVLKKKSGDLIQGKENNGRATSHKVLVISFLKIFASKFIRQRCAATNGECSKSDTSAVRVTFF